MYLLIKEEKLIGRCEEGPGKNRDREEENWNMKELRRKKERKGEEGKFATVDQGRQSGRRREEGRERNRRREDEGNVKEIMRRGREKGKEGRSRG